MLHHNLIQGSPEWLAFRAIHCTASDAAAMLGISPYKSRDALLQEKATGIRPEADAATQRRFDEGHRIEALARPLAEKIVEEELYPVTGSSDEYPRLCFATQDAGISAVRPAFATEQLLAEQTKWPHCNHTIAFDEAIANPDRHIGNLFRRRAHDFVLIDHGFLLRNSSNFPQHWQPGVLASMLNQAFANLLHYNTYIFTGRTAPTVCEPACRECEEFVAKMQPQVRQALFEIAFWCNKLLPGRSAQWLNFLYSRTRQPLLSALLHKRFGLLDLTHART